jgi:hypothetical protein
MQEAIPANATGAKQMEAFLGFFETLRRDPKIALYFRLPALARQPEDSADLEQIFSGFRAILTGILRQGNADGTMRPLKDSGLTSTILMNISLSFIFDLEFETASFAHTPLLQHYDSNTVFLGFYDLIWHALGIEGVPKATSALKKPPKNPKKSTKTKKNP